MKSSSVAVSLLTLALGACATAPPRQTRLMQATEMTISSAALRVQVRSMADRFSGLMEVAGEEVLLTETDPVLRRNRLQWLTNGIPAMQQALFQPDPLAALIDGWFLIAQMRYYFEGTEELSPEIRARAFALLDEMESDIKIIVDNAGPDTKYEEARATIYEWARETPTDRYFASRRGSAAQLAEFTAKAGGGALKSIGSVTETLDDLVARIDLNAEWVPKIARWHAMMLLDDYGLETLGPTLAQLNGLTLQIESLLPLLEAAPTLVTEERKAILQAVDEHLNETLTFVASQREILMREDVRAEREAALATLAEERGIVLAALAEERRIVLEALHQERIDTFEDLRALTEETVSRELDRLFTKVLILILVLLGGLAVIAFYLVRSLKTRTH